MCHALAMEKIQRLAQQDSKPHTFLHRQPPTPQPGAFAHQIARLVKRGLIFPTQRDGIAEFHDVIKKVRFLFADKIHAQQSGMPVRDGLVFLDAGELTFIRLGIAFKFREVDHLQRAPLAGGGARQPDFAVRTLGKGGMKQFVAGRFGDRFPHRCLHCHRRTAQARDERPRQRAGQLSAGDDQPRKPVVGIVSQPYGRHCDHHKNSRRGQEGDPHAQPPQAAAKKNSRGRQQHHFDPGGRSLQRLVIQ